MDKSAADFDIAVIGGGPAGATAAAELANRGHRVALIDRPGRIKPCGGAIPPRLLADFDIPESQLVARATSARMISPSGRRVDMPIEGGFVGMVDREQFDEFLRQRAVDAGAVLLRTEFRQAGRNANGEIEVSYREIDASRAVRSLRTRAVIGADGANSRVARQLMPHAAPPKSVAAYHEIVRSPDLASEDFAADRCEIHYRGELSPDFYAWVFPHGDCTSVGVGSAQKGFSLRGAVTAVRDVAGMADNETLRREGAPIPLQPLRRWDNGRDTVLAGDAAGAVAPASGEGIYYAMTSGRLAAEAMAEYLATGNARVLRTARRRFMREHGRVFWVLGIMQSFWYSSDARRERFVSICQDPDVQYLTWQAYMHKRLVKARPMAHAKIFLKDMAHLLGLVSARR